MLIKLLGGIMLNYFIYAVIGYLVGSIPFSYLAAKKLAGIDIREHGRGNAGATNVFRVTNKSTAAVAFLGDLLKGAVIALILKYTVNLDAAVIAGVFSVVGHCYPIFLGIRGGKGVATTGGIVIAFNPLIGLILAIYMFTVIGITRIVSLASISGSTLYIIIILCTNQPLSLKVFGLIAGLFVIYKHKANIKRLIKGEEKKLTFKKK